MKGLKCGWYTEHQCSKILNNVIEDKSKHNTSHSGIALFRNNEVGYRYFYLGFFNWDLFVDSKASIIENAAGASLWKFWFTSLLSKICSFKSAVFFCTPSFVLRLCRFLFEFSNDF